MRPLITSDLFKFARIINKPRLKEPLKAAFSSISRPDVNNMDLGFDIAFIILEAVADDKTMEHDLYNFIAPIVEKEPSEFADQTLEQSIMDIVAIVEGNDIGSFFRQASLLIRK